MRKKARRKRRNKLGCGEWSFWEVVQGGGKHRIKKKRKGNEEGNKERKGEHKKDWMKFGEDGVMFFSDLLCDAKLRSANVQNREGKMESVKWKREVARDSSMKHKTREESKNRREQRTGEMCESQRKRSDVPC